MPRTTTVTLALSAICVAMSAGAKAPRLDIPAGTYTLDPNHSSLTFRVMHHGLARYTARFTDFDATVELDPARLERSKVTATVDVKSIETDYEGEADFDQELATGQEWFDGKTHPQMRFDSQKVRLRKDGTLDVTGSLSLRGASHPVTLNVKINGSKVHPLKKIPMFGISARAELQRSTWGMKAMLPTVVADEVTIELEAEFEQQEKQGP
jgi:polyisoprenoid-binding protein YceI